MLVYYAICHNITIGHVVLCYVIIILYFVSREIGRAVTSRPAIASRKGAGCLHQCLPQHLQQVYYYYHFYYTLATAYYCYYHCNKYYFCVLLLFIRSLLEQERGVNISGYHNMFNMNLWQGVLDRPSILYISLSLSLSIYLSLSLYIYIHIYIYISIYIYIHICVCIYIYIYIYTYIHTHFYIFTL